MNLSKLAILFFSVYTLSACDDISLQDVEKGLRAAKEIQSVLEQNHQEQPTYSIPSGALTFNQAKKVLPGIYRGMEETFYCGCTYQDKQINLKSCGYQVRKNETRAQRLEWEHVVPAWVIGHQRQCWQNGERKNCTRNDETFRYAEGDLVNLVPSIGEVNGDRSNFSFSQWTNQRQSMYGQCQTVIDFKARKIQPRSEVRGQVARIYFHMSDRYHLNLSNQDTKLFCAWARQHPVDQWEIERNQRIEKAQGFTNEFVRAPSKINLFHWFCLRQSLTISLVTSFA